MKVEPIRKQIFLEENELFGTPRLAHKLESVRAAAKCVSILKSEVRRVGAMTGSSQLHRQPCLVSICTFDESKPVLKCLTPKPGKGDKAEFQDFLNYAGRKLGVRAARVFLITKLLVESSATVEETIRRLRREKTKLDNYVLTGLSSLASGDVVLIEDSESVSHLAMEKPFDLDEIRSSVPYIGHQYIRTLVDEDEEKKELLISMTELPTVNGFKVLDRLGKGGIRGYSFLAEDERGFQVVLKEYKPDRVMNSKALSACLTSQMHCMLEHINILPVREFFVSDSSDETSLSCWSVQHYFPCRSVLDEIENQKDHAQVDGVGTHKTSFTRMKMLDYTVQALRGLRFLHDELKKVHGSIKPSNLFLDDRVSPTVLKLVHLSCGDTFQPTWKGATRFRSPESLESGVISKLDDMFSIGSCIAAMTTGIVDRERGIKGHFGNNAMLIQETIRDVSRKGNEVIASVVRNLLGKEQHRLSAAAVLSVFENAFNAEKGDITGQDPMKIVRAYQMSAQGPGAYAGVEELLDAVRRSSSEQAEEYLKRLCSLCTDMSQCTKVIQCAGYVVFVDQLQSKSERAVECAAMLIGQLCTSDSDVKQAFHAHHTVDALLLALESHKSKPLVIEKICNTITLLCTDSHANCEDLDMADGVSTLHKVTCDGNSLTGTPSAKKNCSLALRVISLSRLHRFHLDNSIRKIEGRKVMDDLEAFKKPTTYKHYRFRAAVRAVECTLQFARGNIKEEGRRKLEQLVLDAFQSAQQLNKLFQEGLEPSSIHEFFIDMFNKMQFRPLSAGVCLSEEDICCVVKEGAVSVQLADHHLESVQAVNFCTGHLLRLLMDGIKICALSDSILLVIPRTSVTNLFRDHPLVWKTLQKIMHSVELGDRAIQVKQLSEKRKAQEARVRTLLQLQLKKQASAEEVDSASKELDDIEAVLMNLRTAVNKKTEDQKDKQRRLSFPGKAVPTSQTKEMFVPLHMRNQLSYIVQCIADQYPKCMDAMRLLRDTCHEDGPVRQQAGQEGAIQALLNHCKGSNGTNVSKALAVEALCLLCSGQNGNKKLLAQSQGVQTLVSMLEYNIPRQGSSIEASNVDIYSVVEVCRGNISKDDWIKEKQTALLTHFPASSDSHRLSAQLRKTLEQCSSYVVKGATREDACKLLARSIFQNIVESIRLQENAAHALWVICQGESDHEAYIRFVLGKAGGIGALVEVIDHCTNRAQEFSAAALCSTCADNLVNRLIFHECHGVPAICRLLSFGTPDSKEHAAAILRIICDGTRRVNKGNNKFSESSTSHQSDIKGDEASDGLADEELASLNTENNHVRAICTEAINLGCIDRLTELLKIGTVRAKTESAWAIRNICLANSVTQHRAASAGTLEALINLSYSEFKDHHEHSAAAIHALCLKHPVNSKAFWVSNGIPALIKVITHSDAVAKENACLALLAVFEAHPRSAFDLGPKGKECLVRLMTAARVHPTLWALADKVLQNLRMILSAPALYFNDD